MQKPLTVLFGAQGRIPHAVRLVTDQSRGILEEATAPIALVLLARFHSWRLFASLFNFRQLFCYISHHDLSLVLLSTIDNNINNCKLKSEKMLRVFIHCSTRYLYSGPPRGEQILRKKPRVRVREREKERGRFMIKQKRSDTAPGKSEF